MIPLGDPLGAVLGCAIFLLAVAAVITELLALVMMKRQPDAAPFGFTLGAIPLFIFAPYLILALWPGRMASTWITLLFFLPAALGLWTMLLAGRSGLSRPRFIVIRVAIVLITIDLAMWGWVEANGALAEAAKNQRPLLVLMLLPFALPNHLQELLMVAAQGGDAPTLEVLLRAGARPTADMVRAAVVASDRMWKPATPAGALAALNVLLDYGADPNGAAVETAWGMGRLDLVRVLKRRGARDDLPERFDQLMNASAAGDVDRVKALATGRILKYQSDGKNRSPFTAALQNDQPAVAQVLLERYPDSDGMALDALQRATRSGDMHLFRNALALKKSNICLVLPLAAGLGRLEIVHEAIVAGCDLNVSDQGSTPLNGAAREGHADVVRDLVAAGARLGERGPQTNDPQIRKLLGY